MEKEEMVEEVLKLKTEVRGLTDAINVMHKEMSALNVGFTKKIEEINEKLNNRLPLWATAYIALMTSAVVGLLVKSHGG